MTNIYITLEIKTQIEAENIDELKVKAFDKCEELLKTVPNSAVKSVEYQQGYYTGEIKKT